MKKGKEVFIANTATVIGDVTLGDNVSVWFGAVVRGDSDSIEIGDRSNIQDTAIVHVDPDTPTKIGNDVTIEWDPFEGETKWEVKMHFINDDNNPGIFNYGETTQTTMTMPRPHGVVGLCEFFVRSYKDGAWQEWHSSDSEAGEVTINGEQIDGNWIVYWMLAAPVWE